MKHPRAKRVVSIVVIVLLFFALTFFYMGFNGLEVVEAYNLSAENKMDAISGTVIQLLDTDNQSWDDYIDQLYSSIRMTVPQLRSIVIQEGDAAIHNYGNGCVVRRGEDGLVLPEDREGIPPLEPQTIESPLFIVDSGRPFEGRSGAFWSSVTKTDEEGNETVENMLCIYCRIYGAYYYVEYTPESTILAYHQAHADITAQLISLEESYNCNIVCFADDEDLTPIYIPDALAENFTSIAAFGIDPESGLVFQNITIDDQYYIYAVSDVLAVGTVYTFRIALLIPYETLYGRSIEKGVILLAISMVIFILLDVWVLSVIGLMRGKVIRRSQRLRYSPTRVRLVTAAIGIIGAIVISLTSMFTEALTDLYSQTQNGQTALATLQKLMDNNREREDSVAAQRNELYLGYAGRIAELLAEHPDLNNVETLQEMCAAIDADYLMTFDDHGRELLSNSRYVDLAYGTDETSSTYDFRRLIKGVPSIVHEACVDEVTGLNRQLIGVCMDDGDTSDGYGSLIVALQPGASAAMISLDDILRSVRTPESLILSVNRETGDITLSSDEALEGRNAFDLGMSASAIRDGFMDYFTLDGNRWYGCSAEFNDGVYYYAVPADTLFEDNAQSALPHALIFLIAYAILALTLLWGYSEKRLDRYGARVVEDEVWFTQPEVEQAASRSGRFGGLPDRVRGWWRRKTPERKAWFTFQALLCLGLWMLIDFARSNQESVNEMSIISYVFNGRWEHGVNIFALTRIVVLAAITVLALLAVDTLFGLLSSVMETRGETICRLLSSLLKYALVITALFMAFESLGFDTRTLLASLGIFSLAISLGAKDLVADVLAGVSIVFSGEYQIGEIIEVGGFRGRVWEIGVRSTTLLNDDGNIKNVSNRNISNVMNLSRMDSWVTVQVTVDADRPLSEIEAMAARELPAIGSRIEAIVGGPEYRGVQSMGGGRMTLAFCAECREQDVSKVRSLLNVELMRMFDAAGITIR